MKIEYNEYKEEFVATGTVFDRRILAYGPTRQEAFRYWAERAQMATEMASRPSNVIPFKRGLK